MGERSLEILPPIKSDKNWPTCGLESTVQTIDRVIARHSKRIFLR